MKKYLIPIVLGVLVLIETIFLFIIRFNSVPILHVQNYTSILSIVVFIVVFMVFVIKGDYPIKYKKLYYSLSVGISIIALAIPVYFITIHIKL